MQKEPSLGILEHVHASIVPGKGTFYVVREVPVRAQLTWIPRVHSLAVWIKPVVLCSFEEVCVAI